MHIIEYKQNILNNFRIFTIIFAAMFTKTMATISFRVYIAGITASTVNGIIVHNKRLENELMDNEIQNPSFCRYFLNIAADWLNLFCTLIWYKQLSFFINIVLAIYEISVCYTNNLLLFIHKKKTQTIAIICKKTRKNTHTSTSKIHRSNTY